MNYRFLKYLNFALLLNCLFKINFSFHLKLIDLKPEKAYSIIFLKKIKFYPNTILIIG